MNITPTIVILIIVVCLLIAIVIIGIQVTKISRAMSVRKSQSQTVAEEKENAHKEAELMQWVDSQMDKTRAYCKPDFDLRAASELLGLSQRHLTRLMKSHPQYGTFTEYLTQKRLGAACKILREKPFYKVESVAHEAGFSSRKTFQTLFKSRIGMTPSAYRDKSREQEP